MTSQEMIVYREILLDETLDCDAERDALLCQAVRNWIEWLRRDAARAAEPRT